MVLVLLDDRPDIGALHVQALLDLHRRPRHIRDQKPHLAEARTQPIDRGDQITRTWSSACSITARNAVRRRRSPSVPNRSHTATRPRPAPARQNLLDLLRDLVPQVILRWLACLIVLTQLAERVAD